MAYLAGLVNTTGATSASLVYPTDLRPGDIVIVSAAGSSTFTLAYSDGFSTYNLAGSYTTAAPYIYVHQAIITTPVARGTTLNITWGALTRNPVITLQIFRPEAGEYFGTPVTATPTGSAGVAVTTLSITSATPTAAAGQIFVGTTILGSSTATVTGDGDTLGAAWSTAANYTNATSARTLSTQYKITSNRGAQTFNQTFTSTTAAGSLTYIPVNIKVAAPSSSDADIILSTTFSPIAIGSANVDATLRNYATFDLAPQDLNSINSGRFNPTLVLPITGESGQNIYGFSYSSAIENLSTIYSGKNYLAADSSGFVETVEAIYDIQAIRATSKNTTTLGIGVTYDLQNIFASATNNAIFNPRELISPIDTPSVKFNTFGDGSGDLTLSTVYSGRNTLTERSSGSLDIENVDYLLKPQDAISEVTASSRLAVTYDLQNIFASATNNAIFNPRELISPIDPPSVKFNTFGDSSGDLTLSTVYSGRNTLTERSSGSLDIENVEYVLNPQSASGDSYAKERLGVVYDLQNISGSAINDAVFNPRVLASPTDPPSVDFNTFGNSSGDLTLSVSYSGKNQLAKKTSALLSSSEVTYDLNPQNSIANVDANLKQSVVYSLEQLFASSEGAAIFNPSFVSRPVDPPSTKFATFAESSGDLVASLTLTATFQRSKIIKSSTAKEAISLEISPIPNAASKSSARIFDSPGIDIRSSAYSRSFSVFREKGTFDIVKEMVYSSGMSSRGQIITLGSEHGPFIGWGIPLF